MYSIFLHARGYMTSMHQYPARIRMISEIIFKCARIHQAQRELRLQARPGR